MLKQVTLSRKKTIPNGFLNCVSILTTGFYIDETSQQFVAPRNGFINESDVTGSIKLFNILRLNTTNQLSHQNCNTFPNKSLNAIGLYIDEFCC